MENVALENVRAARGVMENVQVVPHNNDGRSRHGYPPGYHFIPEPREVIRYLNDKLAGHDLPHPLPNIFHDESILDFHPAELYEKYRDHEEAGYIYFFSYRRFPKPRGARMYPMRVAKGGVWKASGGSKPVSTEKRGGAHVGYIFTMVFHEKNSAHAEEENTDWAMHEYTSRIAGPNNNKKVADLAVYRLYNKKKKKEEEEEAGQGQQQILSLQAMSTPMSPQQKAVDDFDLANWDNTLLLCPPLASSTVSGPAAVKPDLPTLEQQDAERPGPEDSFEEPLKMLQPPPAGAAAPAAECYLDEEFKVWCEMDQKQPAMNPCLLPMPADDDLPMLTDEENQLFSCTFDELLGGTCDEAAMSMEEPDMNDQVQSSKGN